MFKGVFDPIEVLLTGDLVATALTSAVAIEGTIAGTTTISAFTGFIQSNGNLDVSALVFTVTNLAVIADADNNGVGVLTLGATLAVAGDLRVEGADVIATDGTIDLSGRRILFVSDVGEAINVTTADALAVPTLTLDATTFGTLTVTSNRNVDLVDVNCDNVALQSTNAAGNVSLDATGQTITVVDDVIAGNEGAATSTGTITLRAANIVVRDTVLADDGNITIEATNDIRLEIVAGDLDDIDNDGILDSVDIDGDLTPDADNLGVITTISGNITSASQCRFTIINPFFGIDKAGCNLSAGAAISLLRQQQIGQWLQPLFAGDLGAGTPLWPKRQIQIFNCLKGLCDIQLICQCISEMPSLIK